MNRISLKAKLITGFGLLILILIVMATVTYTSVNRVTELDDKVAAQLRKEVLATSLDSNLELQTSGTRGFVLSGTDAPLQRREEGMRDFDKQSGELQKMLVTERGKALMVQISEGARQVRQVQQQAIDLRKQGKIADATAALFTPAAIQARSTTEKATDDLIDLIEKLREDADRAGNEAQASLNHTLAGLTIIGLVVGIGISIVVIRSITGAISRMLTLIQELAQKNLVAADMEITSEDEIGKAGTALNEMKNSLHEVIQSIAETAQHVASAGEQLSATSQHITANSEETSAQANVVSEAAQQVNTNLQSVSTGAEEMTSTIQSIASNAHQAATVATNAVQTAQAANTTVAKLGVSSSEIGEVIKVITSIAQQTNLLALNATIEAARAGEAGKGFAVVANEVKELAKQTAKATEDISRKITAIQTDTQGAVDAIGSIAGVINQVSDISATIATAVEEQSATTTEMTRNVSDAAKGSAEISRNIEGVAEAARGTSASAQESQKAANQLAELAVELRGLVSQFRVNPQTATVHRGSSARGTVSQPKAIAAGAGA
ncbi:MAG TPA: methyl-accepting chemotaxis protein [Candidatus Solibacter sp.]|nr:methyl-accepting chemotaxis protein [Candidatus Solibacter sp.]